MRILAALGGAAAFVGLGSVGLSIDAQSTAPGGGAVLAPATSLDPAADEVTTTSTDASFRPDVTATPPAPPT